MIEKIGYHALRNVPDTLSRIISKVDELVDAVNDLSCLHRMFEAAHNHSNSLEQEPGEISYVEYLRKKYPQKEEKLAKVGMCIATLQDLEDELRKGSIE